MKKQLQYSALLILCTSILLISCQKEINHPVNNEELSSSSSNSNSHRADNRINVSDVAQLYAAINNPENAGSTIVLAEGTYLLSPNYPKSGRLELQHDMSLVGQRGHPGSVIIDVTNLPPSSLTLPPIPPATTSPRVGAVRMGNGNNSIEWMTLQNDPAHSIRSLIQTDIIATAVTQIRIVHCIIKGSSIGMSIINREPAANGRIIEAEIEDNEIMDNTLPQFGSGIQIQNSMGVSDAAIYATLKRNYIHGNKAGMLAFNASSQRCIVEIKSHNDILERNGLGLMFNGGFIENANNLALGNSLKFEAYSSAVRNNTGNPAPPFSFPAAGVYAAGGEAMPPFAAAGTAHHNRLEISFNGCIIEDNTGSSQVNAYGGHSFHASLTPVGTNNATKIFLHGLSKQTTVSAVPSFPVEAEGTNTIAVYR